MKILFVIPSLSKGGAERVISILASELVKQGYNASILIYFKTENEYEVDDNVKKIYLSGGFEAEYNNMNYISRLTKLRGFIKSENPDYVIPFLSHVCIQTCVALFGLKYKIVQTVRNDPKTLPSGKVHRLLRDVFIRFSYKTFVQNQEQKNYFNKKIHNKIFVLPNPVRGDLFNINHKNKNEKIIIASDGRLNSQKNFFMLIDAVDKIAKKYNNIELRIYGDGDLKEELQQFIDSKGLSETFRLMGRTNDMKTMLSSIDLYVLSSDFEGMPNSLMEAMAAGVPCISTDCPTGPSDLIEDGVNGLLVPVGDTLAMSRAIEKMLFESDKDSMAEKGREFIKSNFSADVIVNKLLNNIGG